MSLDASDPRFRVAVLRAQLTILLWEQEFRHGMSRIALGDGAVAYGDTRVAIAWPLTLEGVGDLSPRIAQGFLDYVALVERQVWLEEES